MVHASTLPKDAPTEYDFIVLGGGAAGATVAGRLAENPKVKILLVEAGIGDPADVEQIMTPARAMSLRGSEYDWQFRTTMVDTPKYFRTEQPNTRGKTLGGSTSLNYFTWVRGSAAHYDKEWAPVAGEQWGWEALKPYFAKPSTYHPGEVKYDVDVANLGSNGPLPIAHAAQLEETKAFRDNLQSAWKSTGRDLTLDVFDGVQKGLFPSVNSVCNGRRSTSAVFIEGKKNITLMAETRGKRVLFADRKAIGLEVIGPDGREYKFYASREVILSAGVYETPKILMLSGIGQRLDLEKFGIPVVVDSKHVGQNLLDHPIIPLVFKLKDGYSADSYVIHPGPKNDAAMAQYNKDHTGPYSSPLLELVGFPRIDEYLEKNPEYRAAKEANGGVDPFCPNGEPHFEIDFVPVFADAFQWHFPVPEKGDYLTVVIDLMRPLSSGGQVTLNSADPTEQAHIDLAFLSNPLDLMALREGARFIYDLVHKGEGMKDIVEGDSPWPLRRDDTAWMDRQVLERFQTGFHPCGTARIGRDIGYGVVSPELEVHRTKNLRVVDASIFPSIPDCRIQNVVYMVAEKGADMIKAAHPDLYK